jgi:hypothetical protein
MSGFNTTACYLKVQLQIANDEMTAKRVSSWLAYASQFGAIFGVGLMDLFLTLNVYTNY